MDEGRVAKVGLEEPSEQFARTRSKPGALQVHYSSSKGSSSNGNSSSNNNNKQRSIGAPVREANESSVAHLERPTIGGER